MKMFNNDRKFEAVNIKNQSWICSCSNQFMNEEIQYMMYFYLSSFLKNIMFDIQRQCNYVFIKQLKNRFLKQYIDVWMNVYNMRCTRKSINIIVKFKN